MEIYDFFPGGACPRTPLAKTRAFGARFRPLRCLLLSKGPLLLGNLLDALKLHVFLVFGVYRSRTLYGLSDRTYDV